MKIGRVPGIPLARPKDCAGPAIPACGTSRSHRRVSGRHYSSLPRPASEPPPRCRHESSPTAPVDRWLRADHPSQTTPPTASPYRRTRADPSAPPRIMPSRIRLAQRGRSDHFSRRPKGTVKWFNGQKGFGFIQPDDGSKDVFVHISAVERAGIARLDEGQKVSFDVVQERGKSAAGNLKAI